MGYYYIDDNGKKKWVNDDGVESDDPISWKSVFFVCFVIFMTWLVSMLMAGCSSQKSIMVSKDSVTVSDTVRHSSARVDSVKSVRRDSAFYHAATWITDSTIISSDTHTTVTITVDTLGHEISRNIITVINHDRDHFRDLTQKIDNAHIVTDSLTANHSELRGDTAVHNDNAIHSNNRQTAIEEKPSWWDRLGSWVNGLGIGIVLAVFGFIAWRIYKA